MTYLRKRRDAFYFAFRGLKESFRKEPHMRLHALFAVIVAFTGSCFSLSGGEWLSLGFSVTLVMISELVNTAIEKLCDLNSTETRDDIRYIKDISAAFVLLACIWAVVTGLVVFLPRLLALI